MSIKCLEAVKKNGMALQYVKRQTKEICLKAVEQNWKALQYVKNPTKEMYLKAMEQDWSALKYIKDRELFNTIMEMIRLHKTYYPSETFVSIEDEMACADAPKEERK